MTSAKFQNLRDKVNVFQSNNVTGTCPSNGHRVGNTMSWQEFGWPSNFPIIVC